MSGPLDADDTLTGRLSLVEHSHDGFVDNLTTGGRVNSLKDWAGRGIVRYQPTEDLSVTLSADFSADGGSPGTSVRVLSADAPALFFGAVVPADPYKTTENYPEKVDNSQGGASAKVVWNLGETTLTALSAYRYSNFFVSFDSDGTNLDFVNLHARQKSNTLSQDLQLTSNPGSRFDWILGLSFFHENANSNYLVNVPPVAASINPIATNNTDAYAAYAQGTYHLLDDLQLTAGLRYSYEHKDATLVEYFSGALAGNFVGGKGWGALTPKFGIQYLPTDDVMVYASATRGFKSGGFNSTALQNPQGFNPEYVWSYESGVKSTFFDKRLRLNADVFYYDYKNLQVNVFNSTSITTLENAASATIKGLELEADAVPVDGWTLGSSFSFLEPKYGNYVSVNPDNPGVGPVNLHGNTMVRAPKFSMNLSSEYTMPVSDAGAATGRVEYFYRSRVYFSPYDLQGVSQAGYGLWNARLTFDSATGPWSVSAFVNNLTNQAYYQERARTAGLTGTIGWVGDPRTFGIEIGIHN